MSTTTHTAENDCGVEQYTREDSFEGIIWTHSTGLEVEASRRSRPTQMHAPLTAGEDEFWHLVARHNGEFVTIGESVPVGSQGRAQSGEDVIVERAREWMAAHSDGQLEADR